MEESLEARRSRVDSKLEEIQNSIKVITSILHSPNSEAKVDFELGDTLYTKSTIPSGPPTKVNLWLGANVMLEYGLEEAIELLNKKLSDNKVVRGKVEGELTFVREQTTTVEVDMARVYNWAIKNDKQ